MNFIQYFYDIFITLSKMYSYFTMIIDLTTFKPLMMRFIKLSIGKLNRTEYKPDDSCSFSSFVLLIHFILNEGDTRLSTH